MAVHWSNYISKKLDLYKANDRIWIKTES